MNAHGTGRVTPGHSSASAARLPGTDRVTRELFGGLMGVLIPLVVGLCALSIGVRKVGEPPGTTLAAAKSMLHPRSRTMAGAVESLYVSVAAGVCLYEARRQRRGAG